PRPVDLSLALYTYTTLFRSMTSVENEQNAAGSCARRVLEGRGQKIRQRRRFAILVRQGEIRRLLPDGWRGCCHWELSGVVKDAIDRKSTRLNSSHEWISYAV